MKDETYNFLVIEKNGKTELRNLSSPYRSLEDLSKDRTPCSFKMLVKRESFLQRLMRVLFTNEDFIVSAEDIKNFSAKDTLQRVQEDIGFKIMPLALGRTFSCLNKEGRNSYLTINGFCLYKTEDESAWGDAHINSDNFFSDEIDKINKKYIICMGYPYTIESFKDRYPHAPIPPFKEGENSAISTYTTQEKWFDEENHSKENGTKPKKRPRTTITPEIRRAIKKTLKKHPNDSIARITKKVNHTMGTNMTSFPVMTIAKEIRKK